MEQKMKPGQHVIVALRRMIASGELADGVRIAEIPTAERLGVSRMPVRTALRMLEQEGLVIRLGARGYAARGPTAPQISGAIEVRGVLEGLAARLVAMHPPAERDVPSLDMCLAVGDALFRKGHLIESDLEGFFDYNLRFHGLILKGSGNQAIAIALSRNDHLPFASAAALALDWNDLTSEYTHLLTAHRQHHAVVEAIRTGDPDAAEKIMRSHARVSVGSARVFEHLGIDFPTTFYPRESGDGRLG